MSSRGRSDVANPHDFFPTPSWCVRRLLEAVHLPGGNWLEPCAGDGAIIQAVNQVRRDVVWEAVEIRAECLSSLASKMAPSSDFIRLGSALSGEPPRTPPRVVITNPPFSLAQQFIELGLQLAPITAMLLRLNFLGSEERSHFMRRHTPDVYVLPNRPVFGKNKDGKWATDSIEYAWFVWRQSNLDRNAGRIEVLATTPKAERKADLPNEDGRAQHQLEMRGQGDGRPNEEDVSRADAGARPGEPGGLRQVRQGGRTNETGRVGRPADALPRDERRGAGQLEPRRLV